MPGALTEYHKGWSGALGTIPVDRADMWRVFNDYYLNMIRDTDTDLQQLLESVGFKVRVITAADFPPDIVKRHVLFPPVLSTHPLATNFRRVYFAQKPA